jgi:hypothetical protein
MSIVLFPFSYAVSQDPRGFQKNLVLSRENRTLFVEFFLGRHFFFIRMPSCLSGMLVYNVFLKFLFGRNLASPVIDLVFLIVGFSLLFSVEVSALVKVI